MGKDKLKRFAENDTFSNVFQPVLEEVFNTDYKLKGKWHQEVFKNTNPIVLELGCGKGEYTVELARRFPNKNFIGIDVKGARLWRGAKDSLEENLNNAVFVRTRIEFIRSFFAKNEVSEIWITFPDPQMKKRRTHKRLTSARFLEAYALFLKDFGIIHLKTDSSFLFDYTKKIIEKNNLTVHIETDNLYDSPYADLTHGVKTFYEKMFLAQEIPITYLQFDLGERKCFEETPQEVSLSEFSE